jgi:hypothetical protein
MLLGYSLFQLCMYLQLVVSRYLTPLPSVRKMQLRVSFMSRFRKVCTVHRLKTMMTQYSQKRTLGILDKGLFVIIRVTTIHNSGQTKLGA